MEHVDGGSCCQVGSARLTTGTQDTAIFTDRASRDAVLLELSGTKQERSLVDGK